MRFLIPLGRLLTEYGAALSKSSDTFSRGPRAGHKYIKRVLMLGGGKKRYRYYYAYEKDLAHGKLLDEAGEHDHYLSSALREHHPNLVGKIRSTIETGIDFLKGLFGFKKAPPPVKLGESFTAKYVTPHIENEKKGMAPDAASPMVRTARALELIPDYLKALVDPENVKDDKKFADRWSNLLDKPEYGYKGLSEFVLNTNSEDDGRVGGHVGGYMDPSTGTLRIMSVVFEGHASRETPAGEMPQYGSNRTLAEEVIWHEFGHHVHWRLFNKSASDPALATALAEWTKILPGNHISEYAKTPDKKWGSHGTDTGNYEDFAESFSCMLSHPQQMADRCPERYVWMQKHVLPHLPTIEEVMKLAPEQLAWWEGKSITPAGTALALLRRALPAGAFHPYYSDADQFYAINKEGRTVYIRFGPADKNEEERWKPVPSTTREIEIEGQKISVAKYTAEMGTRFYKGGSVKEIYDEYGRAMTDQQAFLYLAQDDEEVNAKIGDPTEYAGKRIAKEAKKRAAAAATNAGEKQAPAAPKAEGEKVKDTHLLSYRMYTAMGASDAKNTEAVEVSRTAKTVKAQQKWDAAQAKPEAKRTAADKKTLAKERPDFLRAGAGWVPIEMPPHEFVQKSGTFKFGAIRSAKEQPHVAKDASGAPMLLADGSPMLRARVYEQENPDGTFTRLTVNEEMPLQVGDTVLLPDKAAKAWVPRVLTKGDPLDPYVLARRYGTTANILLAKNGKYAPYQLVDPIAAQMVNPGDLEIPDATKLSELLREAAMVAGMDPVTGVPYVGRRAWVTVDGDNGSAAHIQLQWDGAGPPKVVGDYWQRRKKADAPVRIDQLLNEHDSLDIPAVTEAALPQTPFTQDAFVYYFDPRTKQRMLGTLRGEKELADGTKAYSVEPIGGETAASREPITVAVIEAAPADLIPDHPDLRRRHVEALEHDLLLYLDEVPRDSTLESSGVGVIRVKLPKDGFISRLEVEKMPGITISNPYPWESEESITLQLDELPRFRNRVGGFVMDRGVLAKLQDVDTRSRMTEESGKTQIVEFSDLQDKDGNINPDGPLRNLVTGKEGIQPQPHRMEALQHFVLNNFRLYAMHFMGTGKTGLAIMAGELARNCPDPTDPTKLHPNAPSKRCLTILPKQTAENTYREFVRFKAAAPTLIGASGLSGAQQIPKAPDRKEGEHDDIYWPRAIAHWKAKCEENPRLWNPWKDPSQDVVISNEYFRNNEALLYALDQFDAMIGDEAHKYQKKSKLARAIGKWTKSPKMKMVLLMSGTPITNKLTVLPRMVDMVSGGAVSLGTDQEFEDKHLIGSAHARELGKKKPAKTDLNPANVAELMTKIQPMIHVATVADVKNKSMPKPLLDENSPMPLMGQQKRMYRAAGANFNDDEREMMEASGSLGLDEAKFLKEDARRKIGVMRSITNTMSYKSPDQSESILYEQVITDPEGKSVRTRRVFALPSLEKMLAPPPLGWGGKWPSLAHVSDDIVNEGYLNALRVHIENLLGIAYEEKLEGKVIAETKVGKELLDALESSGEFVTRTGDKWMRGEGIGNGGGIKNPDYGPEGMTCRGTYNDDSGEIEPLTTEYYDPETGKTETITVPVGYRFVRDPNRKSSGLYFDGEHDWDWTGRHDDTDETGDSSGEGGTTEDDAEDAEDTPEGEEVPAPKGKQAPKTGLSHHSIQRHPDRRRQRAMFDAATTSGNAKCDGMEQIMCAVLSDKFGAGDKQQFIIFGQLIGSSCRTAESKMRQMGYMDVNEALGDPAWSSDSDKKRANETRKFFVSYMGGTATLGDRDINSEIFKRQQDMFGKDAGISMFVWRTLYGSESTKLPMARQGPSDSAAVREPWGRAQRESIEKNFVNDFGRLDKNGKPERLEVPMRVSGKINAAGQLTQDYVYESDLPTKIARQVEALEIESRTLRGDELKAVAQKIAGLIDPYWTERKPLSDRQIDIFNSAQVMVASDAAQMGLCWPANNLFMYDSRFSPMEEAQRIARAARMLPEQIQGPAKDLIMRIGAYIRDAEEQSGFKEYEGVEAATMIVREAINHALTPEEQNLLATLPGAGTDQIVESWFAQRAFDKIEGARAEVGIRLRAAGSIPDPARPKESFISPHAIQEHDIMNEILRNHLTPFDRQILRARRCLVDVKRLTTSVTMREFKTVTETYVNDNGKTRTRKKKVATNNWVTESPTQVERMALAQGKIKGKAYEFAMKKMQEPVVRISKYDYLTARAGSLSQFSELKETPLRPLLPPVVRKAMHAVRFVVPRSTLAWH